MKEATVSYFVLRHRLIEEYSRENSKSVKQYARIVWASVISSLEVTRYKKYRNIKIKVIFKSCLNLCFLNFFRLAILVSWLSSGWKYTSSFLRFFILINL